MFWILLRTVFFDISLVLSSGQAEDIKISPFHMKPLGSHVSPTNVDEVTMETMLTPKQFMENYMLPRKPLVFRGVVKEWPAFKQWTNKYLRDNYPKLELRMEGRKEKRTPIPQGDVALGRDTMKHFIDTYQNPDVNKYVVSELPTPLYKYVNIPRPLGCGELRNRFTEINLWINSGGAQSVLHKDSPNTINCVVNGSKEWKLFEFKYNNFIYQAWEGPQEAGYGGHSLINPEKVDLQKFPNILKIPQWFYTHVQAGDCLYLPTQMWHVVYSHGNQNIAVAFLMSQFQGIESTVDLNLEGCADKKMDPVSLDQIDVDWQYPGYGNMTMGYSDIVDYLSEIKSFFRPDTQALSKKRIFQVLYMRHTGTAHQKEKAKNRTRSLFETMNKMSPDGKFTLPMVSNLTRPQLREIITYLEAHYPAGTLEYEYSYFTPEQLKEICWNIAEQSDIGKLKKSDFVSAYIGANGSPKFAEEFWLNLAGEKDQISISEADFPTATAKYDFYRDEPEEEEDGEQHEEDEDNLRNQVPGTEFYTSPKSMKPDFRDDTTEDFKTQKRKVNQKEPVVNNAGGKTEL